MNNDLMFSSKTDQHNTPVSMVNDLSQVFSWDLDVCSGSPNVCKTYFTKEQNSLIQDWGNYDLRWANVPYGRGIGAWYEKAANQKSGATVMLVPSRTDTKYWHEFVPMASQVVFIKGRLKFGDAPNSAPFPSAFVVFGEISDEQRDKLASYGISYSNDAYTYPDCV